MTCVDVVFVGSVLNLNPRRVVRTYVAISVFQEVSRQFRNDYVLVWLFAVEPLQRGVSWLVREAFFVHFKCLRHTKYLELIDQTARFEAFIEQHYRFVQFIGFLFVLGKR